MNWVAFLHNGEIIKCVGTQSSPYNLVVAAREDPEKAVRAFSMIAGNGAQFLVFPNREKGESFDFFWDVENTASVDKPSPLHVSYTWVPSIKDADEQVRTWIWNGGTIMVLSTGTAEEIAREIKALEDSWQYCLQA